MRRAALVCLLVACGGRVERIYDQSNRETPAALAPSACDGAPLIEAGDLFAGRDTLAATRPANGSEIAIDGRPRARMLQTLVACDCCNSVGYILHCAYALKADADNDLCLSSDEFACGGKSCAPFCTPFSTDPKHTYRFVGNVEYLGPPDSVPAVRLKVTKFCRLD